MARQRLVFSKYVIPTNLGSSGKRVPGQFTGEERDCKNVIPAKAGIQEGRLAVAKQFSIPAFAGVTT
jgi:hypothetical protein